MALKQLRSLRKLTHEDLLRFEETLKPPFRRALNAGRVDLLPAPKLKPDSTDPLAVAVNKGRAVFDKKGGRLVVPLSADGRALGLLVIWQVNAEQLHPAVSGFLTALVEAALDMVRLKLAAETDPVTGLNNPEALDEALTTAISRMKPSKVRKRPALDQGQAEGGLSLLALEPAGMGLMRERFGRRFGDRVLREVARQIVETVPEAVCAARAGEAFLLLIEGGAHVVREVAQRLNQAIRFMDIKTPQDKPWRLVVNLGAATTDDRTWQGGGLAAEAAAVFKARALRALARASESALDDVLFFNEIVEKTGRLKEILPMDRVRIDLGRVHGLMEAERFQIIADQKDEEQQRGPKAEIVVVSVGEDESLAEVVALLDPTLNLRPGDRLRRLGREISAEPDEKTEQIVSVGGRKVKILLDEVTSLASHRSFVSLFSAMCAAEPEFVVGLMRIEGMEGMREVCGRVGTDSLLRSLAAASRDILPSEALMGRFSPDTLGFLLPAKEPAEIKDMVSQVLVQVGEQSEWPLRAGLAGFPCPGFAPADLLHNAAKALIHAGFFEPGAVVCFDAISLNISGDTLFAQGRISEAVAEYERGLLLDANEPNLLNSLGVGYGHLGQADKARECFERALIAAPEDFMAYYNLGYALMSQGRLAEARERFEQSLKLSPGHADTLFQLGRLAQGDGRLTEAVEFFEQSATQPEHRRAVHRHLGEVLAAAGRFTEAEDAFKRAVKATPHDSAALSGLAGLYLDREANLEIALSLARRAFELEPQAARHVRVMARALMALGRLEEAVKTLRQAVAQHQEDPFLAVQLAQAETACGDSAAARDEFTRALTLEPNLEAARQGLAALEKKASPASSGQEPQPKE